MTRTLLSQSNRLTLDQIVRRLGQNDLVDGVVVMGSGGTNALTDASDYDLLVVLRHMPAPMGVALTYIDGRLTDIVFTTTAVIDGLIDAGDVPSGSREASIVRWLRTGKVLFDRTGRLGRLQEKASSTAIIASVRPGDTYRTWFAVNFNLTQTRRMLLADDAVYGTTVDVRLLFSLHEVWVAYFLVRGLEWSGDKEAIRYLQRNDAAFLDQFQTCLAATDRADKVARYEKLAARALEPAGGLWEAGSTAIQFEGADEVTQATVEAALVFWEGLIDAP